MIKLHPDQIPAVEAISRVKRGIVKAPAGSGKTILAAAGIARLLDQGVRLTNVIWLANTLEQCDQAKEALWAFGLQFRVHCLEIACYQSGKQCQGFDLAILDECHHVPAETFRKCLAGYEGGRWGFSATDKREDELADDVYELIGPVVYEVPREALVKAGRLAEAKVYFHAPNAKDQFTRNIEQQAESKAKKMESSLSSVIFTESKKSIGSVLRLLGKEIYTEAVVMAERLDVEPEEPLFALKQAADEAADKAKSDKEIADTRADCQTVRDWLKAVARKVILSRCRWMSCQKIGLTENTLRNRRVTELANQHYIAGDSILILVGTIDHGKELQKSIVGSVVVYSKMGDKMRRESIEGFRDGKIKCMIATSLADEGLDVPRANVLILAAAGRSETKAEQRTGRVLRSWSDKTHGTIHDFWDHQHPLLRDQARARAKVYAGLKYDFVGTREILPTVLTSIGIELHPALGMVPKKKKKDLVSTTDKAKAGGYQVAAESTTSTRMDSEWLTKTPLPVPVLAEPRVEVLSPPLVGAARESTTDTAVTCGDSRGGQRVSEFEVVNGVCRPNAKYISQKDVKPGCRNPEHDVSSGPLENPPSTEPVQVPTCDECHQPIVNLACRCGVRGSSGPGPDPVGVPVTPAERQHARLSPSILKAKAICPGFINDPDGDKTASTRGTLGHDAVEKEKPDLCGDDVYLRKAVEDCIKYKRYIIGKRKFVQEVKLRYLDQWGFCDLLVGPNEPEADLIDWKFAYNLYEADSPQFWAYCVGVWDRCPKTEKITVHVGHPFLDHIDVEVFTRREHYAKFVLAIKTIIAFVNANDPESYRVTPQCAYCGIAGKCRKLAKMGLEIGVRYAPEEITLPAGTNFHGSEVTDPAVMAQLQKLSRIMESAAKGWRKAGLDMYDKGTNVPGYTLGTKGGNRSLTSPKEVYDIVKEHFVKEMKLEDFLAHCEISATTADEIIRKATPKGKKDAQVKLFNALLEDADVIDRGGSARFLKLVGKTNEEIEE